jgi:rRNA maturation endonuclease Nob1
MEEVCEICGGKFKNIILHKRMKHGADTNGQEGQVQEGNQEGFQEELTEVEEEVSAPIAETPKLFAGAVQDYKNMTLKEYMDLKKIEFADLNALVGQFKEGKMTTPNQVIKQRIEIGAKNAEELKDRDKVSVHDVSTAEQLVKNYGFKVTNVKSGPPRTWVLEKN